MMCEACEESDTVYLPYFGKPGGWRPPARPAGPHAADEAAHPAADVAAPDAPPRFACDGPAGA
jgi:hypothetical protein